MLFKYYYFVIVLCLMSVGQIIQCLKQCLECRVSSKTGIMLWIPQHVPQGLSVCKTDSKNSAYFTWDSSVFMACLCKYHSPISSVYLETFHIYLSFLVRGTRWPFRSTPSDPTAAATSVERALTDNTLSDTWVMYKLQRAATDLCNQTVTEGEC